MRKTLIILSLLGFLTSGSAQAEEVKCRPEIEKAVRKVFDYGNLYLEIVRGPVPVIYEAYIEGSGNCDPGYYFQVMMTGEGCEVLSVVAEP